MNHKKNNNYDIIVVGGGVVGILISLSLEKIGRKVTLIEKLPSTQVIKNNHKTIVLSYSSTRILYDLGILDKIKKDIEYIHHVHVSNRNEHSQTNFYAAEEKLPFLGIVIRMMDLMPILYELVISNNNIRLCQDAQVVGLFPQSTNSFTLSILQGIENCYSASANLIIAADGSKSILRKNSGIRSDEYSYNQSAIVFDLYLEKHHQNIAYEHFTDNGILALLPINDRKMTCIWSINQRKANDFIKKEKQNVLKDIQGLIGYQAGHFIDIGTLKSFPLSLVLPEKLYKKNLLLFGNASHFFHPVSGQGLNLSIHDVRVLCCLCQNYNTLISENVEIILSKYQQNRIFDHKRTAFLTHSMISMFAENLPFPLRVTRNLLLYLLEKEFYLKKSFGNLMMGGKVIS